VRQGHFAEGEGGGRGFSGGAGEAVGGADGEDQGLGVAVLMILEELGEFFGAELAAAGVEQDDGVGGAGAGFLAKLQEGGFVGELESFGIGVALDALQVVVGQGLDGQVLCFANPGYF